jgi:hypothetical protein
MRAARRTLSLLIPAVMAVGLWLASATFGAAAPPSGARIDMRVLLRSATGSEPTFGAWKAALTREGVPFDAKVADALPPLDDSTFADYASNQPATRR